MSLFPPSIRNQDSNITSYGATTCICCLDQIGSFINLETCLHTEFIFNNCDFMPTTRHLKLAVCIVCHRMLDKISLFGIQVKESMRRLAQQVTIITSNRIINNLQYSTPDFKNTLFLNYNTQEDVKLDNTQDTKDINLETTFIPVKLETEDSEMELSNDDMSLPLSEIKKDVSRKKKKNVTSGKVKKKSFKTEKKSSRTMLFEKKYKGKIRLMKLTAAELENERETSKLKDTYQKLAFKCEDCIKGFDHETVLQEHRERQHTYKEGSLQCEICKCYLTSESSLAEHCRRHFKRYECVKCSKRYVTLSPVIVHYNESHAGAGDSISTQYTCQECGASFPTHRSYRYHCEKHKGKEQCNECGNTFVNRQVLKSHMLTVHLSKARLFTCLECGAKYKAKSGLLAHMAHHKPTTETFQCASCQQSYKSAAVLKNHLKMHSMHRNDRLYKLTCDHCGCKFPSPSSLQDHIHWDHLDSPTHRCSQCDKVFKHRSGLRKHTRSVHDKLRPERNKICDYCGRAFCTLQILRAHLRTHTGERPLKCAHCDATFAHTASLYTHNKLVHKVVKGAKNTNHNKGAQNTINKMGADNTIHNMGTQNIINKMGAQNTIHNTGAKNTINYMGAQNSIHSMGAQNTIHNMGAHNTINNMGAQNSIQNMGAQNSIHSMGAQNTINKMGAHITIHNMGAQNSIHNLGAQNT